MKKYFMRMTQFLIVSLGLIVLLGCATTEAGLRDKTAGVLGYAPEQITISNMRSDESNTYYTVTTPKGEFACTAESGVVKALQLGLINPPICNKK